MIDRETGALCFERFTLRPHLTEAEFLCIVPPECILPGAGSCAGNASKSIYLRPQRSGAEYFVVRAFFDAPDTGLWGVLLCLAEHETDLPDWKRWCEARELQRKGKNDAWLTRELGAAEASFPWGSVRSVYNSREASSYIFIRYDTNG